MNEPGRASRWARWGVTCISPWVLALALLAFLLPFSAVSCAAPAGYGSVGGGVTAKYRGVTLALGGQPDLEPADRVPAAGTSPAEDHVSPQPLAVAALALTIAALVAAFTARSRRQLWVAALSSGALVFTALAQLVFDRQWTARMVDRLTAVNPTGLSRAASEEFVQPAVGFWVILLLLGVTALANGIMALTDRRRIHRDAPAPAVLHPAEAAPDPEIRARAA
jgi:hypothetical protein